MNGDGVEEDPRIAEDPEEILKNADKYMSEEIWGKALSNAMEFVEWSLQDLPKIRQRRISQAKLYKNEFDAIVGRLNNNNRDDDNYYRLLGHEARAYMELLEKYDLLNKCTKTLARLYRERGFPEPWKKDMEMLGPAVLAAELSLGAARRAFVRYGFAPFYWNIQ